MSTTNAAETESVNKPTVSVSIIDQPEREKFDTVVRGLTGVPTPPEQGSEAYIARSAEGDVVGVAYMQIRHLLGPWLLVEGSPRGTLTRLSDVATDQLRAIVRETIVATGGDSRADRGLSYDIYVPAGQQQTADELAAAGFERLDVEVWRRRVC